jgi:hypothetical protein
VRASPGESLLGRFGGDDGLSLGTVRLTAPQLSIAFHHTARVAANRRSDRRFHIIMGCIFGGAFILPIALALIIMANEPERRAAYMAKCQETGFSQGQCTFLYADRRRQDADTAALAAAIAIGTSVTASQAMSGRCREHARPRNQFRSRRWLAHRDIICPPSDSQR